MCFGNVTIMIDNTTGIANFSSTNDWSGTVSCNFTSNDGQYDSNVSNNFVVTVNAVNDAPVIGVIPNVTIAEDSFNDTINLSDYVSDVDDLVGDINWNHTDHHLL